MNIEKINDLPIISKLNEHKEYYNKFKVLVEDYADFLDSGAIVREIGFTPHDFSHHCCNIYEILGYILPDEFYTVYSKGVNLFVLLTAVLFHDISMAQDASEEARRNHSKLGQKFVLDEMLKDGSSLNRNCEKAIAKALGDVIYAHSDVKGVFGETIAHTFKEVVSEYADRSNIIKVDNEELNVPFLAALLRLSDELDISYKRVEGTGYKDKVNIEGSKPHYQICEYFNQIQLHTDKPHELSLEVLGYEFDALSEEDKPTIAGQIIDKYLKIKKEFDMLYQEVLSSNKYAAQGIWRIEHIRLKDENKYRDFVKKKEN